MDFKNVIKFVTSIVICQLAGVIGSIFIQSSVMTWYATLSKPAFNPPDWIFAPVWITLYLLMGISLYIIWSKHSKAESFRLAMIFFGLQLALNAAWPVLFFGFQYHLLAILDILLLCCALTLTILQFYEISKPAAYLLLPYLFWLIFATFLNMAIITLNSL